MATSDIPARPAWTPELADTAAVIGRSRFDRSVSDAALAQQVFDSLPTFPWPEPAADAPAEPPADAPADPPADAAPEPAADAPAEPPPVDGSQNQGGQP